MAEQALVSSKRTRGAYAHLICLGCHERRIKCDFCDEGAVPDPGELRTTSSPCDRCKKLGIPCVGRRTRLGRSGRRDGSTTLAAEMQEKTQPPARSAVHRPQDEEGCQQDRTESVIPTPQLGSRPLPVPHCMKPAKIQILPLRRTAVQPRLPVTPEDAFSSSDGQLVPAKRTRASKPKVKTGCLTCKIRRIKCDEAKPGCLKCSSTGRKCDGYPAQTPTRSQDATSLARLPKPTRGLALSTMKASSGEMRALEYFCVRTAPALSMYFDHDLWNGFIVQASVAEPAIRHAMVALSVLAEQRELRDVGDTDNTREAPPAEDEPAVLSFPARIPETDPLALRNYNTSVSRLSKLASSPGTTDTVLLACILFVCIELLRGDAEAAIGHFKGGMTIIADHITRPESSQLPRLIIDRVKNKILPVFNRLEMLYALFGNDASWQYPTTLAESVPDAFVSLEDARDSLVNLLNLSLRFVRTMDMCRYESFAIPALAFQEQAALLSQLVLWHQRFSACRTHSTFQFTSKDLYACNILEIQRLVASTWVSVATTPFESSHDAHIPTYAAAVSLAEQLPALASSHAQSGRYARTFTLDVEIVGPIHWVSIKCRDPVVRRRAIAVLRGMHGHEGMWDSRMAAIIAERVIAVEEVGVEAGRLPSEEARVHYSSTDSWPGATSASYSITHQLKPSGVYGDWEQRVERFASQHVLACGITGLFAT